MESDVLQNPECGEKPGGVGSGLAYHPPTALLRPPPAGSRQGQGSQPLPSPQLLLLPSPRVTITPWLPPKALTSSVSSLQ